MSNQKYCVLLIGEANSRDHAKQIANRFKNCPFVQMIATKDKNLYCTLFIPEQKRSWVEYIKTRPEDTFGVINVQLIFMDEFLYPQIMNLQLPHVIQEVSPCGSNCGNCPGYQNCSGCPATPFYKNML